MGTETAKLRIECQPNGPYRLHDPVPSAVAHLVRPSGEACAQVRSVALCRCGGSKNKPFCDGTHRTNGFSDARTADPGANPSVSYAGKRITIHDNRAICAHAGVCSDTLATVFLYGKEPWIDPDGAAAEEVMATIARCPSGALSYSIDGAMHTEAARPPTIVVTDDGPYAVSGGIELSGVEFGDGASREHYTLCRCGASANKPFCDGSHGRVKFTDP